MEETVRYFNIKGFTKEIVDQINRVIIHKKVCFTAELLGARGRSRTESFDNKNNKSQFKWNFQIFKVEEPGEKQ